jgi:NAD(P)-dependent dehydrogenase (short-subunit alcohol dehydrogenase family)
MESVRRRVVLITGASSGIGKACAEHLQRTGYQVYGASRSALEALEPPSPDAPIAIHPIHMDVTSDDSVERAVKLIAAIEGRIDVVVNCAGYGLAGALEDTQIDEARDQMETNFFGVLRVCRAVLPIMRAQGTGYVINISSVGGLMGIPFQGLYSASKFAVEGLSETLSMEVQPYGIKVVLIEPGDFCTGFTTSRRRTRAALANTVYAERSAKALAVMESDEQKGHPPEQVALLLEKILKTPAPRLRYTIGPPIEMLAVWLKKVLPARWYEKGLMKYYRLT